MPSDYSKCKMYTLTHITDGVILVRYASSSLEKCLTNHKQRAKMSNSPLYAWIDKNGGWDMIDIHLLEDFPCNSNKEAHDRLMHWINEIQPKSISINKDTELVVSAYQNGKIYKLVSISDGQVIYVGSTKNVLEKRVSMHKYSSTTEKASPVHIWIQKNGGWENVKAELVELYPCNSKKELEERERYWIEQLKPITNLILPTRSSYEWRQLPSSKEKEKIYREENIDTINAKRKEYRESHKEQVSQGKKDWYEKNKEKVKERMKRNYEQNKEAKCEYQRRYGQENKEKIAEASKAYREANAETIKQKEKERRDKMDKDAARAYNQEYRAKLRENKIHCEACGLHIMRTSLKNHMKSKMHLENVANFSGWLLCDGSAVSRTTYSDLYNVIGTYFGNGDGVNTFNLPDMRGRVAGGVGAGVGLTTRALGAQVGAETHTLSINEMPSHNHGVTDPGHAHGSVPDGTQNIAAASGGGLTAADEPRSAFTASATTGITINANGGGQAHNNMQPTLFLGNVFIYSGLEQPDAYPDDISGTKDTDY